MSDTFREEKWAEHQAITAELEALPPEVFHEALAITAREHKTAWAMLYTLSMSFLMSKGLWDECTEYLKEHNAPLPPIWNESAVLETAKKLQVDG